MRGGLWQAWLVDWAPVEAIGTAGALLLGASAFAGQLYDRRREQARLVSAWIVSLKKDGKALLRVRNGSTEPVYRVRIESTVMVADPVFYHVLPPGAEDDVETGDEASESPGYSTFSAPIRITFVDAAGRRWQRHPSGRLRRRRWSPKRRP